MFNVWRHYGELLIHMFTLDFKHISSFIQCLKTCWNQVDGIYTKCLKPYLYKSAFKWFILVKSNYDVSEGIQMIRHLFIIFQIFLIKNFWTFWKYCLYRWRFPFNFFFEIITNSFLWSFKMCEQGLCLWDLKTFQKYLE